MDNQRGSPPDVRPMPAPTDRPVRSQFEDFMRHVSTQGVFKADRTGTGMVRTSGGEPR